MSETVEEVHTPVKAEDGTALAIEPEEADQAEIPVLDVENSAVANDAEAHTAVEVEDDTLLSPAHPNRIEQKTETTKTVLPSITRG